MQEGRTCWEPCRRGVEGTELGVGGVALEDSFLCHGCVTRLQRYVHVSIEGLRYGGNARTRYKSTHRAYRFVVVGVVDSSKIEQ